MLLDCLRELGHNFDPYAYNDEEDDSAGNFSIPPVDPVDVAGCFDVAKAYRSAIAQGRPTIIQATDLLLHGFGRLFIMPLRAQAREPIGGKTTRAEFHDACAQLTRHNTAGRAVLRAVTPAHPRIAIVPIFLVRKTSSTSRFIFDGRKLNQAMLRPPPVSIPCMADLLTKLADNPDSNTSQPSWTFILLDYRHWFHQFWLPQDVNGRFVIRVKFATPSPVASGVFGFSCPAPSPVLDEKGHAYYGYQTLPMGLSWSPYIAENLAWCVLLHTEAKQNPLFVTDDTTDRTREWAKCIDAN
jgi:hypothetical protein